MSLKKDKKAGFSSLKLSHDLQALLEKNYSRKPLLEGFSPNPKAMKGFVRGCVDGAVRRGVCEPFYKNGTFKGCLLILSANLAPGLPCYWGFVQTDQSKEAADWAVAKLRQHRSFFNKDTMVDVPAYLGETLKELYRMGYFVDTVRTVGIPKLALERLMKLKKPEADLLEQGCTIEKIKGKADLLEVQKIEYSEFKRNPEYGWFVAEKAWLDQSLQSRLQHLKNPDSFLRVIKRNGKVVGYFGCTYQPGFFKGKNTGTEFIFDKKIQGKGFAKVAYRLLLEHMISRKLDFFMGNTSQAPVLALAKTMGRVPQNYSIRFGKGAFTALHFKY